MESVILFVFGFNMLYEVSVEEIKNLLNLSYKEGQTGYEDLKDSCIDEIIQDWLENKKLIKSNINSERQVGSPCGWTDNPTVFLRATNSTDLINAGFYYTVTHQ